MKALIDTNIFLRASDASSAQHVLCVGALEHLVRVEGNAAVCVQVIIEFWAAATRPRSVNGLGMTLEEVAKTVEDILDTFECLDEPPKIIRDWIDLASAQRVTGKSCHDTRLVALMRSHQIGRLITINVADFERFADIQCATPDELVGTTLP